MPNYSVFCEALSIYPHILSVCLRLHLAIRVEHAFSCESSHCLPVRMNSHTHCILLDFSPLCLFKCFFKLPVQMDAKSHWLHLFVFSPLCVFKCVLKWPASEDAQSHWLHLFDFSPLCLFKYVLKSPAREDAYSHWLHLFGFSPQCVFKCVLKCPA